MPKDTCDGCDKRQREALTASVASIESEVANWLNHHYPGSHLHVRVSARVDVNEWQDSGDVTVRIYKTLRSFETGERLIAPRPFAVYTQPGTSTSNGVDAIETIDLNFRRLEETIEGADDSLPTDEQLIRRFNRATELSLKPKAAIETPRDFEGRVNRAMMRRQEAASRLRERGFTFTEHKHGHNRWVQETA